MTRSSYLTSRDRSFFAGMLAVGGTVLAVGFAVAYDRVWLNLLIVAFYLLTIGLGGAVFVALTYVAGAGWPVAFRRVPEAMSRILPVAGLLMLAVLVVRMNAYGWHHHGEGDAGTFWFKELWLTPTFWIGRAVLYVAIWVLLAHRLVRRSLRQDTSPDARVAERSSRQSSFFLLVYAVTFSLASIDWIMALDPMWFSTIFGVYNFSGMFQAAIAVAIILGLLLRAPGQPLNGVFRDEHLHDLGKLLLGFSCFWMYIWFSQYMLIWYSNLPEETSYFITRTQGPWAPVVILSIVLNWIVPFFVLLPQRAKRSGSVMMKVASVVLIGRWVDLYLMVMPTPTPGAESATLAMAVPAFGIWEMAAIGVLLGLGTLLVFRSFASIPAVPRLDPYLSESLHYDAG